MRYIKRTKLILLLLILPFISGCIPLLLGGALGHMLAKKKKQWFLDAKPFIKKMSKDYKLAIVTGSRWVFLNAVFDTNTKHKLVTIITSDDVEHKKPDIEPLEKALGKVRAKKNEVIFIGDSTQDGLMCHRFNIPFIGKTTGISTKFQLKKFNPVFIGNNFKEIEEFIER